MNSIGVAIELHFRARRADRLESASLKGQPGAKKPLRYMLTGPLGHTLITGCSSTSSEPAAFILDNDALVTKAEARCPIAWGLLEAEEQPSPSNRTQFAVNGAGRSSTRFVDVLQLWQRWHLAAVIAPSLQCADIGAQTVMSY